LTNNRFNPGIILRVAEKRWVAIVSTIVACLVLSGLYIAWKALTPIYASSCSIKFEPTGGSDSFINRILSDPSDNIETQQAIILSHDFLKVVAVNLSLIDPKNPETDPDLNKVIEDLRSRISFKREEKTDILRISATAKDPVQALKFADMLSSTFITSYREEHDKRLIEVIAHINEEQKSTSEKLKVKEEELERFIKENRLISIDLEGEALLSKKNKIEDKVQKNDKALEPELKKVNENIDLHMDKKIEFDKLKMEVESIRNIAAFLEKKRQEAMIRKAENPDDVTIISPAQLALSPVNEPDYIKIPLIGLITGIILGLLLTAVLEVYDHSSGLIEKLEKRLSLRVIGIIPKAGLKDFPYESYNKKGPKTGIPPERHIALINHFAPKTLIAESFRGLRANVLSACREGKIKTIAVTGSYPGEGNTMVSVNLAISLAQAGMKTLLVGSDLNNPDVNDRFYLDEGPGLTDILIGTSPWEETVKTVTDIIIGGMTLDWAMSTPGLDKLNIITKGALPNKPGELFGPKKFTEFLDAVREVYDIIILDSSPVLSSSDASTLAAKVDGIICVYNPAQVTVRALKRTCAQLGRMSCNILGIVLNCVRPALIPDALREKYTSVDRGKTIVQPPVKKGGIVKVLIPIAVIVVIIAMVWWQRDKIFPERPETKVKEIVKAPEIPAEEKPQKPETPDVKPQEVDKPESKSQVEVQTEKVSAPEAVEQKQPETTPEPSSSDTGQGFNYQEGRYPYSVYLGSFDSTDQARSALEKYSKAGITSFWVKVDLGEKGIWYRVYSGEFADKESAGAFINDKAIKDGEIKKAAYAVYIGGFSDPKTLEEKSNILKEKGYSPYIITDENGDNLLTGAFVTKAGAEELNTELIALGIANKVVLR
jgi:Mrp family chromosome partitioning ATPase/uncharacterized protein involved in exopolysaccharide biosynthesis/cell division septation protein DedD